MTEEEEQTQPQTAKCGVDVVCGVLPGTPEPKFTRQWFITSAEWNAADQDQRIHLLSDLGGRANGYAQYLMFQPDRFNWVKTEWIWF